MGRPFCFWSETSGKVKKKKKWVTDFTSGLAAMFFFLCQAGVPWRLVLFTLAKQGKRGENGLTLDWTDTAVVCNFHYTQHIYSSRHVHRHLSVHSTCGVDYCQLTNIFRPPTTPAHIKQNLVYFQLRNTL